jgi:chemotaxis protein MotB
VARKSRETHGGGHGWFVTFADLMGLLVSFFVMLVAFSNQDAKMMHAVAGSMREAFGVQAEVRDAGIREVDGLLTRPHLKHAEHIEPEQSSLTPSVDEHGSGLQTDKRFALAAASLRQAMQNLPELTEASKHIVMEDSPEGLNIELVDQDGSSMFSDGSKNPYDRLRTILENLAGPLRATKYPVSITGHTAAKDGARNVTYGPWELSVDRANAARQVLEESGFPSQNIYKVAGAAATEPLVPENASAAPNRRITITLMNEAPPVPPGLRP